MWDKSAEQVWIDALLRAGLSVEVCKVVEEGDRPQTPVPRKKKSNGKSVVSSAADMEIICLLTDDDEGTTTRAFPEPKERCVFVWCLVLEVLLT